ncbi:STAS domain-containing protein [Actinoallomurus sp. CA-142502]|uniref:STAS domain-containing protein n=1 Tax=Actinoallomurus sp. CA-142502 TaxID=3239885 RepID=UPI003D8B3F68
MDDPRTARPEVTLVTVTGTIDIFTAPRLRESVLARIDVGAVHLLVDLERAVFADPTAAALLIGFWWRVRARGGRLSLAGAPAAIRDVFQAGRLSPGVTFHTSVEEALREYRPVGVGAAS